MLHVRLTTGNKGGICKTFCSIMMVDFLYRHGKAYFALDCEGDGIQATFARVLTRAGVPISRVASLPVRATHLEEDYDGLIDALDQLRAHDGLTVIIDTGASMQEGLQSQGAYLQSFFEELKESVEFRVVFMVGPTEDSAKAAKSWLESQALLASPIPTTFFLTPCTPALLPTEAYVAMQDTALAAAMQSGQNALAMCPATTTAQWQRVMCPPHQLPGDSIKDAALSVGTRRRMRLQWLPAWDALFSSLLQVK